MLWLPLDDKYSVSDEGYVMNHRTGHILALQDDRRGYARVDLHGKHRKVHRLVASRFLPAPVASPLGCNLVIDHIDRDRLNNCPSNLRWVSVSVNNRNRSTSSSLPLTPLPDS
jgi:hypothetical protein